MWQGEHDPEKYLHTALMVFSIQQQSTENQPTALANTQPTIKLQILEVLLVQTNVLDRCNNETRSAHDLPLSF